MKKSVDSFTHSAEAMVEDSEKIFTELISFIKNGHSEFKKMIADQEKAKMTEAVDVREQLEQNVSQLKKIKNEMEYLSCTQDHIHFLQSFESLCQLPKHEDLPKITMDPCCFSEGLMMSVFGLQEKLEDCCRKKLANIGQKVNIETVLPTPETRIRGLFLQHACQLSLDHNTVHENLFLFNNDTEVIRDGDNYYYPSHPERFDSVSQILCKEGLSGCCYWEVQWSGEVYIGVSYKEIGRKGSGNDCCLGHNDKSWSLHCSNSKCCFRYNNSKTSLPLSSCPRIGVYLDHKGGILSFYRVSDIMTLIHRVQTTFTQPLYPGFRLFFPIFGSAENIITLCPLIE
nr:tripartite motif-containing protein 16-like [Paramormyrops kingsleyae]